MLIISMDLCNSCNLCTEVCINGAIIFEEDTYKIDSNYCQECNSCKELCPEEAIVDYDYLKESIMYVFEEKIDYRCAG